MDATSLDFQIPDPQREVTDYIGPRARIVLIGEAPGRREAELGEPFVGPSEAALRDWWRPVGLTRQEFYITNVYPIRPGGNEIGSVPRDTLGACAERLRAKLANLRGFNVIVPTGNTALWALWPDGIGPAEHLHIGDWRGSILEWTDPGGNVRKVIPTIHPAATFRQPVLSEFCAADWRRIAAESHSPLVTLERRHHIIDPSEQEINDWMNDVEGWIHGEGDAVLAVDIEHPRGQPRNITCVGFSYDPMESLTIPLDKKDPYYASRLQVIREICGSAIPKVLQHGLTDQYKLWAYGVPLRNYRWDLIEMAHCLNPNDGGDTLSDDEVDLGGSDIRISMKSLAVLASLYTRIPYWKHLAESPDWETRQIYNGLDCCATREIFPVLRQKLIEKGMW